MQSVQDFFSDVGLDDGMDDDLEIGAAEKTRLDTSSIKVQYNVGKSNQQKIIKFDDFDFF